MSTAAPEMSSSTDTQHELRTTTRTQTREQPDFAEQWAVVLLDDDDHSYEYVIEMMQKIFSHKLERAFKIAQKVDADGRAVCMVTHKELAELKQEQVHSYGKDFRIDSCAGAMSSIIEPATSGVPGDDSEDEHP